MNNQLRPQSVKQLFGMAIAIELTAADFYDSLSQRFAHEVDVSDFWHQLSLDEKAHAAALENARDRLTAETLAQSPDDQLARRVVEAHRQIDGLTAAPINTLDDAYELAHDIEFSEVNAIFKVLATEMVPVETHRQFVLDQIETHQKRLLTFGAAFGDRAWRRQVRARML